MVLFKRKVIPPIPPQTITDENQQVWFLEASGEIFATYEAYLTRVDFFRQKKFICEVSGHSNLSYWEALRSEKRAALGVDQAFPESLKEPVLRKIQFSTISRLDHLVEYIYDAFKTDYYPGETLTATIEGFRCACLIREKTKFNALMLRDGTYRPALARYRVEITTNKKHGLDYEQSVESEALTRDRNSFNKALIRSFIKNSCSREAWNGAPWLVKERYARKFRIDTTVPDHLKQKDKVKVVEKEEPRRGPRKKVVDNDIKYPIDDLDDRLAFDAASRPRLKDEDSIDNAFLGDVMSTWTFLTMFGEPLHLDSFTLDDYIDALRYQDSDFPCDLISEIHCCLLKSLVNDTSPESLVVLPTTTHHSSSKSKNGIQTEDNIDLVKLEPSSSDETSSDQGTTSIDSSSSSSATDTPFMYTSLLDIRAQANKSSNQSWTDWRTRVHTRDFASGGWEYAVIGILDELGNSYRLTTLVVDILEQLLPEGEKHTRKSAAGNYVRLEAKLKVKIIQLLLQLVCQTPTVREFIEECMSSMTELRKEKVEVQRERKAKLEELATLEAELHPYNNTPEESVNGHDSDVTELDVPLQKRSVKASLKRKREEQEELAATMKRNKEYAKKVKVVENKKQEIKDCEDRVVNYDLELREKDCLRLRLLGKDRFFNRYWVLEGNGISASLFRGDGPQFSSARLWVQGPSVEDATYYLGGAGVDLDEIPYGRVSAVDTSVVNEESVLRERILLRKEREEGQSVLYDECQWGYYDDVEGVEGLLAWLNPKGTREAKLRQAILSRKESMYKLMEARDKYLRPETQPVEVRRSTRITSVHAPEHRFLKWHNTSGEEKKRGWRRGG